MCKETRKYPKWGKNKSVKTRSITTKKSGWYLLNLYIHQWKIVSSSFTLLALFNQPCLLCHVLDSWSSVTCSDVLVPSVYCKVISLILRWINLKRKKILDMQRCKKIYIMMEKSTSKNIAKNTHYIINREGH